MLDADCLSVWCEQRLVGHLRRNIQNQIGFRYEQQWLTSGYPISRTLPLQIEEFAPDAGLAHRYFANLLPEGRLRERIVRDLKIADTDFNLLRAIGGECAGALSIMQSNQDFSAKPEYLKISDAQLADLTRREGSLYGLSRFARPRLSLAGTQNKCPVVPLRDGEFLLPINGAPSSHILKFESTGYRNVLLYETFTTALAKAIGLPVVDIRLRTMADRHYVQIERYDRLRVDGGNIVRLHQEDFCQALGYGHESKYQEYGGPSFTDCCNLIRDVSSDPGNDLLHLLRWQIFNVLAGNSDGHAKNLSLLYRLDGQIRLAPFYDIVCTRAIESIDYHLAFAVGNQRDPGNLTREHWDALAQQCGLRTKYVRNQVREIAVRLREQLGRTTEEFEQLYGEYAALQRVERIVKTQCRRTIREIAGNV